MTKFPELPYDTITNIQFSATMTKYKKHESIALTQKEIKSIKAIPEETQILELLDIDINQLV